MKYAIVEDGGKQYRAVEGGTIEVDHYPSEIGEQIDLERVLLIADGEELHHRRTPYCWRQSSGYCCRSGQRPQSGGIQV
jgi:ribosomal protein L21